MTPPARRLVVLRTSRDTLVLVACTVGMTLAVAHAVRQRPAPAPVTAPEHQVWAGQLAEVSVPAAPPVQAEPMTSASLVVPATALALPQPPSPSGRAAKATVCDAQPCPGKVVASSRPKVAMLEPDAERSASAASAHPARATSRARDQDRRFGLSDLNPLPHLPEVVRKPFSYAGTKLSGLIDWF